MRQHAWHKQFILMSCNLFFFLILGILFHLFKSIYWRRGFRTFSWLPKETKKPCLTGRASSCENNPFPQKILIISSLPLRGRRSSPALPGVPSPVLPICVPPSLQSPAWIPWVLPFSDSTTLGASHRHSPPALPCGSVVFVYVYVLALMRPSVLKSNGSMIP